MHSRYFAQLWLQRQKKNKEQQRQQQPIGRPQKCTKDVIWNGFFLNFFFFEVILFDLSVWRLRGSHQVSGDNCGSSSAVLTLKRKKNLFFYLKKKKIEEPEVVVLGFRFELAGIFFIFFYFRFDCSRVWRNERRFFFCFFCLFFFGCFMEESSYDPTEWRPISAYWPAVHSLVGSFIHSFSEIVGSFSFLFFCWKFKFFFFFIVISLFFLITRQGGPVTQQQQQQQPQQQQQQQQQQPENKKTTAAFRIGAFN